MAAHLFQAVIRAIEAFDLVDADAADMGGCLECALQGIGPGVVGTDDQPVGFLRGVYELDPAMTADVVKDTHHVLLVVADQQGQTHEINGLYRAGANSAGEPDGGPVGREQLVAFVLEARLGGVGLIRHTGGVTDRLPDRIKLRVGNQGGEWFDGDVHGCNRLSDGLNERPSPEIYPELVSTQAIVFRLFITKNHG